MQHTGNIEKMRTAGISPVAYTLVLKDQEIQMNDLIGKPVQLTWTGKIHCVVCGKSIKKTYGQGFCFDDFSNSPENADCILKPELCQGHLGIGRDPQWELEHHVQETYVYLALTSEIKVGVTRLTQVPTRWIDQGAWKAVLLAKVPYRKLAGEIEVALKAHLVDKTNWQLMLKNEMAWETNLAEEKKRVAELLPEHLKMYVLPDEPETEIQYPVETYPTNLNRLSFDKEKTIAGTLAGIRGQYLIFQDGGIINLRTFTGYEITLEA